MTLSFRIGRIPVQVAPSFFLTAAFLAFPAMADAQTLLLWIPVVLGSVLVHELGHATTGVAFGLAPRITLHGMGGTTSWAASRRLSTGRRLAITLAGPGFGFLAAGAVVVAHMALVPTVIPPTRAVRALYGMLLEVNFGWGLFNLIPMLPLDGGDAMAQVLDALTGGRGERPARVVSLVVAAAALALALLARWWWPALLAGLFASMNWRALKDLAARDHDAPLQSKLAAAYAALDARDGARVLDLARPVALDATTSAVRAEALQLVAFGFLLEGSAADADAAIAAMPKGYSPHPDLIELRAKVAGGPARPPC